MKIAIILGTRPEIIKFSPIIRLLVKMKKDYFIIHSNQHYSQNMDRIFFKELELPKPDFNLEIGSADHGNQTGRMLIEIEKILLKEQPSIVLSQGDTNTVLAGILAASKQNIPTGHVEAGLRSYDRRMPEEKNRIICDVISEFLFAPTKTQETILRGEGIPNEKIFVVGNTIVDAVYQHKIFAQKHSTILNNLNISNKKYVLFTAHRALNVDRRESLKKIIRIINETHKMLGVPIIYPIHPRTRKKLTEFNLHIDHARLIEPVGYTDFLNLQIHSDLIITDSGGIQEEACILQIPCITIRENTERPETLEVGANKLIGLDPERLKQAIKHFQDHKSQWDNPFGDGKTSEKILEVITSKL